MHDPAVGQVIAGRALGTGHEQDSLKKEIDHARARIIFLIAVPVQKIHHHPKMRKNQIIQVLPDVSV